MVGALHVDMSGGECCNRYGARPGTRQVLHERAENLKRTVPFGFLACLICNSIGCVATPLFDMGLKRDAAIAHEGKAFAALRSWDLGTLSLAPPTS